MIPFGKMRGTNFTTASILLRIFSMANLVNAFDVDTPTKGREQLLLTPTEASLLKLLCRNPGQALTGNLISVKWWDNGDNFVGEHALTIQVSCLRSKDMAHVS